jgi:hypothetical protein
MGWKIYDEPVEMVSRRFKHFPHVFRWRGQRHQVEAVERRWTVVRRGRKGLTERHFWQVQCAGGDFELFQDVRTGTWHLRRARLAPAGSPAFRRLVPVWR